MPAKKAAAKKPAAKKKLDAAMTNTPKLKVVLEQPFVQFKLNTSGELYDGGEFEPCDRVSDYQQAKARRSPDGKTVEIEVPCGDKVTIRTAELTKLAAAMNTDYVVTEK